MRRTCLLFLGGLFLLLSACAPNPSDGTEDSRTQIVATTYPVYLFACEVTRGVPDCTVTLMIDQPIGCLHDYTLTVKDMKALERADIIVCNGAGLEESMESALETVGDTPQIDCAQGIPLLEGEDAGHHHEGGILPAGHEHEADAHIWMDPLRACSMLENLAGGLSQLDPGEENSLQRAWALAGEALLGCPGVRVAQVEYHSGTGLWQVWVETPLGAGQVAVPGKEETDG